MYSFAVSLVLTCMIATGATRSVAVKLFYQLGFHSPLFVTLLYLSGQSLSLIVYYVSVQIKHARKKTLLLDPEDQCEHQEYELSSYQQKLQRDDLEDFDTALVLSGCAHQSPLSDTVDDDDPDEEEEEDDGPKRVDTLMNSGHHRRGSSTGLTEESRKAVAWVHSIPWYLKPVLPGFFNLCNSAMRWASLMFVSASVAEILISGLELVLSVCVARMIRKRLVASQRWIGVAIVTFGLVVVGVSNIMGEGDGATTSSDNVLIGYALIAGQCIASVAQDMAEELFMDEAGFPATLLLGMEGLFGLFFGLLLYFPLASAIGEDVSDTWDTLTSSTLNKRYAVGLTLLFTLTGVFNIVATAVTSSMTRNVWKNLRTILVWLISLLIFYASGNDDLGEPWLIPDSFAVLAGFVVMLSGIYEYYTTK